MGCPHKSMNATVATKPEEKKSQAQLPSAPASSSSLQSDVGTGAGLPIFLQRSALALVGPDVIQLKCDECAEEEREEPSPIQFKLIVGAADDPHEREADRVADAVVNAHDDNQQPQAVGQIFDERIQPCSACGGGQPCSQCAGKSHTSGDTLAHQSLVQTKLQSSASTSSSLPTAIGTGNSGLPVPRVVREKVEPVLGVDLSAVQVHSDSAAQSSAKQLEAKAFTHQNHIWLGPHQSANDVALMAHELAHVVQQTGGGDPSQVIQRQPEPSSDDGEAVRRRLQRRMDEELGDRAPSTRPSPERASPAATVSETPAATTPAPAAEDPQASQSTREVNRAELQARTAELQPEARPDVNRAEEQRPQVEEAARSTAEGLDRPPEPQAESGGPGQEPGAGKEGENGGGQEGERAGRAMAQQADNGADEAFSAADSQPMPEIPEILVPPPEIEPVDAGGLPLPGNPAVDVQAIELANDAQNLREQGQLLREYSAEERTNAQILRGNIGLVSQGIGNSESGVHTAQGNTTFRRGVLAQARQALTVSEQKAANVAAQAPGGVTQASENKSRSGPMASEARDMTSQNDANTPEDPEAAARAREQGGQINSAGSDAATIDDTLTQAHSAGTTLVQDAARAAQLNTQSVGRMSVIEATLGRTEERVAEMQGQNAEARGQLDSLRDQPGEISSQADELDVEGLDLVQASRDIEARLHSTQQSYAEGMRSVPAVAPPEAEDDEAGVTTAETPQGVEASASPEAPIQESAPPAAPVQENAPVAEAAPSEEMLVQRQPEDGATSAAEPEPSNINIGAGLPSWLSGQPEPNEQERHQRQLAENARRGSEIDEINNELHGRRFEQLSAGERRRIALRLSARNLFGGLSNISWPTPGGIARGAAHLAAGLLDPRAPMMGVISGLNMIVNSTVNFARQPSWGGALRLAANVATGLAIILGSITALAGVIAALMVALTIVTLGIAAPITGPVIAFCATVMSTVGGWTFWVGLIAAGLQALVFLVDLYMAGTAQTAEALQQQSERMTEDAGNAGNALLQAGMGRLGQVGGRHMQSAISKAGGGVRFAARTGARAMPARVVRGIRRSGGVGSYVRGQVGQLRAGVGAAGGPGAFVRQGFAGLGQGLRSLPGTLWRELRSGGPKMSARQGFSRDFLLGEGIPRGPGLTGALNTARALRVASRTTRRVVAIQEELSLIGRSDLHGVIDDMARLDRQGRVRGFDDWVEGAHTETPDGMMRHTSELLEARRLQAQVAANPNMIVRIGQDRNITGKSFDVSVEGTPGVPPATITRRAEVFTETAPVQSSRSLNRGISHGADKAYPISNPPPAPGTPLPVGTPPGTREATVAIVDWPPPPLARGGGAQQVMSSDGSYFVQLADGTTRPAKHILDDLVTDLNRNVMGNPKVNYLDAVNIIDRQGNLVGRVVNGGNSSQGIGNWTR